LVLPDEAWVLHEAVRELSPERPITVVEIGSFRGRSTIAAASALLARANGGTLYAIDPQDDAGFRQLRSNLNGAGVGSVVRFIRATSGEARKQFGSEPIDLVFIDGSHEYEDVRSDLGSWLPLVRPGGIVALNDPFWLGVARAIRERLALGGSLRSPRFEHNTLFFTYLPDAKWRRADGWELLRLRAGLLVGCLWILLHYLVGAAPLLPWRPKQLLQGGLSLTFRPLFSRILPSAARRQ
jgi:predicted O-methyltransferase YrrM